MNKLAKKILKINEKNGFNVKHELGTYLMLITSELAECLEADRNDKHCKSKKKKNRFYRNN